MKRFAALLSLVLLAGVVQAMAAGLISKSQAEQDALTATGGGTVDHAYREKEMGKLIWAVDIMGTGYDYEVWVDAHTGAILQVTKQPQSQSQAQAQQRGLLSKAQAEQDALNAVGGGTVLQAHRDQWKGYKAWDIDISQPAAEFTVYVDAHNGSILNVTQQSQQQALQQAGQKYITKKQAEQIALNAVGGGTVLLARLDKTDNPPTWDVDVRDTKGNEFEVKVNAYNGQVIAIIPG